MLTKSCLFYEMIPLQEILLLNPAGFLRPVTLLVLKQENPVLCGDNPSCGCSDLVGIIQNPKSQTVSFSPSAMVRQRSHLERGSFFFATFFFKSQKLTRHNRKIGRFNFKVVDYQGVNYE